MYDHDEAANSEAAQTAAAESAVFVPLPAEQPTDAPWQTALNRVRTGIALNAFTLNFWCLQYLLPAVGLVLLLLGFRALRHESKWFRRCFVLTGLWTACTFSLLILKTTVYQSAVYASPLGPVITAVVPLFMLAMLLCCRCGLRDFQQNAGIAPQTGSLTALIGWYALVCALAVLHYNGLVIGWAMIVVFVLILRRLCACFAALKAASVCPQTAPVRLSDGAAAAALTAVLLFGCACGYLFGGSYPMDWRTVDASAQSEVEPIRTQLLALGFPADVLNDLTAEDIAACDGALQVLSGVTDHPVNEGRDVTRTEGNRETHETVFDQNELRLTNVAVQLPGERDRWLLFHHFLWTVDPGFYGTEAIQLLPTDLVDPAGWFTDGDVTGRVLYNDGGTVFAAPYASLGEHTFTQNSFFGGTETGRAVFAAFSLPAKGEKHRGYLAYPVAAFNNNYLISSWVDYIHQKSWLQYPAMTATEVRTSEWPRPRAFCIVQDALQFDPQASTRRWSAEQTAFPGAPQNSAPEQGGSI